MCKRLVWLMVVLVLCLGGTPLSANTFIGAVNNDWMEVGNWSEGDPYGQYDVIDGGFTVNLTSPGTWPVGPDYYTFWYLVLGGATENMNTLNYNGGGTAISGYALVGDIAGGLGDGTLNINAGTFQMAAIYTGHVGVINMNGGEIEPWADLQLGGYGGSSIVNLNAGLIDATTLTMTDALQSIVIKDGVLDLGGDWGGPVPRVLQYIADDWIRPYPGYTLHTQLQNNDQGIIVWATPEPATIVMLSIGGLFLRRRKH